MKDMILHHVLYKKKIIAIVIFFSCYIALMMAVVLSSDTAIDRLLYPYETSLYFIAMSQQISLFFLSTLLAIIVFDFDASYDLPLLAYFSKSKVIINKQLVFLGLTLLFSMSVLLIRMIVIDMYYEVKLLDVIEESMWLMLDMMILSQLMILITPKRFKQASFLLVVIYIVLMMLQEDNHLINLYYALPFYHTYFSYFNLSLYYVINYIILLFFLVYLKTYLRAY